ncbi:MAG: hypothetical protein ILA06_10485 [Bacteroidaceae bacterium]|nr:hypothetical protein [Bacteroidaceae bacterium]
MQSIIVAIILALCAAYTARRLWHRFRAPQDSDARCAGCPLAETCTHHHDPQHHRNGQDCPRGTACDCCH